MTDTGRDRLRELLDSVLDEEHRTLGDMAEGAYASPFHFTRRLRRDAGEPPVTMRRRVMLERAAWQLDRGASVTETAWAAGYESVEGFSRAFTRAYGHSPSDTGGSGVHPDEPPRRRGWLPAPNGIHFHPPTSLWVHSQEQPMNSLTEQLVRHDLDDTRHLIDLAKGLPDAELREVRQAGTTVLSWDGPEESLRDVLDHLVFTKEVWLAAIDGHDTPPHADDDDAAALLSRHDAVAPRWLAMVRDLDARGAWDDRLVDALCDPPESFVMSSVVAHVLTFSAHRRQVARRLLQAGGHEVDHGDPIVWLRRELGEDVR